MAEGFSNSLKIPLVAHLFLPFIDRAFCKNASPTANKLELNRPAKVPIAYNHSVPQYLEKVAFIFQLWIFFNYFVHVTNTDTRGHYKTEIFLSLLWLFINKHYVSTCYGDMHRK